MSTILLFTNHFKKLLYDHLRMRSFKVYSSNSYTLPNNALTPNIQIW